MACASCSTADGSAPKGCKNNGTCGTDSCNKLTVFDWLSNMSLPNGEAPFNCVEVRFKNGRKEFYRNTEKLTLSIGDIVATVASPSAPTSRTPAETRGRANPCRSLPSACPSSKSAKS